MFFNVIYVLMYSFTLKYHVYLYYVLHMIRIQPIVGSRQVNKHSTVSLMIHLWGMECVPEVYLKGTYPVGVCIGGTGTEK